MAGQDGQCFGRNTDPVLATTGRSGTRVAGRLKGLQCIGLSACGEAGTDNDGEPSQWNHDISHTGRYLARSSVHVSQKSRPVVVAPLPFGATTSLTVYLAGRLWMEGPVCGQRYIFVVHGGSGGGSLGAGGVHGRRGNLAPTLTHVRPVIPVR